MIELIKKIFGIKSVDYAQLVREGAIIVDVRTSGEFNNGHIKGSVNIPVDKIANNADKLKAKKKPIITCCASGSRSAMAKSVLKGRGVADVYNGGPWFRLQSKINNG
ncbi:MAG TPA: rhodanese-like domain-containing protein [Prolixibacteraceae bacterium]|nr:rhodanese-like domain-containing protein [Prolixibacteraceae bacterium]